MKVAMLLPLLLLLLATASAALPPLPAQRLRSERLQAPLSLVAAAGSLLEWQHAASSRGALQRAYQLQIFDADNASMLYDSGQVVRSCRTRTSED